MSVEERFRKHIPQLEGYQAVQPPEVLAGGVDSRPVLKLDANENPYGCSPRVLKALAEYSGYHIYPDPEQRAARQALARYAGVTPEQVILGNGSDELVDLLIRLFVEPEEEVLDFPPTFPLYALFARVHRAQVISVPRDASFGLPLDRALQALSPRTRLIFVATPNNPTGNTTPLAHIKGLLETGIPVVVDEAYYEYCGLTALPLLEGYENLVILRTLSKWAGLAGLRVGYAITSPKIVRALMTIKNPYNVSAAAQKAVLASLEGLEELRVWVRAVVEEREKLFVSLAALKGLEPYPSQANFILCRIGEGRAWEVYRRLARRGIFVRYYTTLPQFLRISVGRPEENRRFLENLSQVLEEAGARGVQRP